MKTGLHGKSVLGTGGASGIGRASCLAFAPEGAKVVVADRDLEGGEGTARMIRDIGAEAVFVHCDVANAAGVDALVKKTVETYGQVVVWLFSDTASYVTGHVLIADGGRTAQ